MYSYALCTIKSPFKKPYNNHVLHISILYLALLGLLFSFLFSTARCMWRDYKDDVGIVRKTLENIESNISEYNFEEIKFSKRDNYCTLQFTHKITKDRHSISILINQEYIHWYKNGKLVVQNGINNGQEYPAFHEDIDVCTSLNEYIFEKIEDIVKAAKRFNISQTLCNVSILETEQPKTKTLEVTAPMNTTITGTVTEQGQIIHTETL